jgi:hypothetical protein
MKHEFQHRGQAERLDLAEQLEDAMRRQGINERRLEREMVERQGSFSVSWEPQTD